MITQFKKKSHRALVNDMREIVLYNLQLEDAVILLGSAGWFWPWSKRGRVARKLRASLVIPLMHRRVSEMPKPKPESEAAG